MNPFRMVWRYLTWRPVITALIIAGIAVGAGLVSGVLTLRKAVDDLFLRDSALYDIVVGGKGSPLQLVLCSVYHMDLPTGNLPLSQLDVLRSNPKVKTAIPISLGDNVDGFRIVGTDESMYSFIERGEDRPLLSLASGKVPGKTFDAALGSEAAATLGLKKGDTFVGVHGLVAGLGDAHGQFPYTVTGTFQPTGTALDRVVFTPLESVWDVHDEKGRGGELEVTSILVLLKTPGLRLWVADQIQRDSDGVAAIPLMQMLRLQQRLLNPLTQAFLVISILVIAVSAISIAISMVLTADRRQRDWQILRNLGARPRQILGLLFGEALTLSVTGVVLGAGLVRVGVRSLDAATIGLPGLKAVSLLPGQLEWMALTGVVILGVAASFLPAVVAYAKTPEVR